MARPASQITLLDVIEAVDGPLQASLVSVGGKVGASLNSRLAGVCQRITGGNRKKLAQVSLAELARR